MPRIKYSKIAFPKGVDALSCAGAGILARRIEAVWASSGHPHVRATCHEVWPGTGVDTWAVRSNLVAGKPPGIPQQRYAYEGAE